MKHASLVAFVLTVCVANLCAQSTGEALEKLATALQKEIDSGPKSPQPDGSSEMYDRTNSGRMMVLSRVRSAIVRGDSSQIEELLSELPVYSKSDEVRKQAEGLISAVHHEREAKEAAVKSEMTAALQNAADAVHKAKEPADLDGVLQELAMFRDRSEEPRSEASQTIYRKLQATTQFVTRWQDYLAAVKAGNAERARESLQNISGSSDTTMIIPRSEILARLQNISSGNEPKTEPVNPESVEEIVAKTKTLEDVGHAVRELRKLQGRNRSSSSTEVVNVTIGQLASIDKTYREFQAGLPTGLDIYSGSDAAVAEIIPLKLQLMKLVLPRYLNLPPDIKPNEGEAIQPFLERVIAIAGERGDASLMTRARDAQRTLVRGNFSVDSAGATAFTAGQNQEAARQFMLAVISYQTALKNGIGAIPAKLIGERLSSIKADHPQEYDAGMERFLNPPPVRSPLNGPPFYPGSEPGYYRGREIPTPSPIPIPGGSPAPESSPAPSSAVTATPPLPSASPGK